MNIDIRLGDCIDVLKTLPDNSVDSVVCDPPYGLSFMNKKWDYDVPSTDVWSECLRVLKPGGHLLAFGGSRTYHRLAVAVEDAGFEIRDQIMWVYGSGFPKSHNIGKAIEKLNGDVKVIGKKVGMGTTGNSYVSSNEKYIGGDKGVYKKEYDDIEINNDFEGWGTALKPAHEPIVMARKPLSEKSVAENVLKWGTGGINIDDCRIPTNWKEERPESWFNSGKSKSGNPTYDGNLKTLTGSTCGERLHDEGRFPANIMFDEEAGKLLDEQSDKASRFFYCPKVSKKERNAGMEVEVGVFHQRPRREDGSIIYKETHHEEWKEAMDKLPRKDKTSKAAAEEKLQGQKGNTHPTVKPIKLMEYLITLVTPKGGVVLDCFMGSGSTGIAARNKGFGFIGIEREEQYMDIAKQRINSSYQTKLDI